MRLAPYRHLFFLSSAVVLIFAVSCSKSDDLPNAGTTSLHLPSGNVEYFNTSPQIGTLGRVLFYDKSLSINNAIACGSCHKQALAFADNIRFSTGFENQIATRNTPPIQNLSNNVFLGDVFESTSFGQALFWDGRSRSLFEMVMQPISHRVEMGMRSEADLIDKIENSPIYAPLFLAAFGSTDVTDNKIATALAGFVGSMRSQNSKFERSVFQPNPSGLQSLANLNALEQQGLNLFIGKYDCMSCHDVMSNVGYSEAQGEELVNIGLDSQYSDEGMGALTGNTADNGKFRIPNLRNVALTAPYMHDGRFNTLEEVIDHYKDGVAAHPNLDSRLRAASGTPRVLEISQDERAALVAFLHTLTDASFITDPKFSDPFVQ